VAKDLRKMRLYVLLTSSVARRPLGEMARSVLAGGADALQLREKNASDRELLRLGQELRRLTAEAGAFLFVNDRPDIARLVEADGVHVGQDDLPLESARQLMGDERWVGVSTHSVEQARAAAEADYIGVGPMYPTATKGYTEGVGPELVAAVRAVTSRPIVAIGGMTPERVGPILEAGATAVAVCSAIVAQANVEAATRDFRRAIEAAR